MSKPQDLVLLQGLGKLKKSGNFNGVWTHDLLACSIVPKSTTLLYASSVTQHYFLNHWTDFLKFDIGHFH
jgi:hypothetical protein